MDLYSCGLGGPWFETRRWYHLPPFKNNKPKPGLFYFDGLAQFAVGTIIDQDLVFAGHNSIPCIALGEGCGG